jgi:hypothetical protein
MHVFHRGTIFRNAKGSLMKEGVDSEYIFEEKVSGAKTERSKW